MDLAYPGLLPREHVRQAVGGGPRPVVLDAGQGVLRWRRRSVGVHLARGGGGQDRHEAGVPRGCCAVSASGPISSVPPACVCTVASPDAPHTCCRRKQGLSGGGVTTGGNPTPSATGGGRGLRDGPALARPHPADLIIYILLLCPRANLDRVLIPCCSVRWGQCRVRIPCAGARLLR